MQATNLSSHLRLWHNLWFAPNLCFIVFSKHPNLSLEVALPIKTEVEPQLLNNNKSMLFMPFDSSFQLHFN
jgi:hypothetical protein